MKVLPASSLEPLSVKSSKDVRQGVRQEVVKSTITISNSSFPPRLPDHASYTVYNKIRSLKMLAELLANMVATAA